MKTPTQGQAGCAPFGIGAPQLEIEKTVAGGTSSFRGGAVVGEPMTAFGASVARKIGGHRTFFPVLRKLS
ncbi:hypothetical protein ACLOJK_028825 [Asimina triloba]